ncbi:MAG: OmpA family protein [Pseudomonadota bacterium]|nr:OmpA family protein [Pseudomonadota bacterium]
MSDQAPARVVEEGLPGWVMTFADLMSLLMCFFVLLLAFSELDVSKYKEMAGSMKNAFGVQREIKVREPPKGINIIAREFSPGRPDPTIMNVVRQMTTDDFRANLDLGKERRRPVPTPKDRHEPDRDKSVKPGEQAKNKADRRADQKAGLSDTQKKELGQAKKLAAVRLQQKLKVEQRLAGVQTQQNRAVSPDQKSLEEMFRAREAAEKRRKLKQRARLISDALGREIKAGSVDVETEGQKIIIRVREKASFGSGRAELKDAFRSLLGRVASILKDTEGKIIVAGHTDNVPIYTERFRSNWELSSARAVSVAHEMMLATRIPSDRFLVQGFADTKPMANNDTPAKRASNRRVEIILQQGEDKPSDDGGISGEKPLTGS